MSENPIDDHLPLYGKSKFERRMRVHQQWWGLERVKRPMGQPKPGQPFPVLTDQEQLVVTTSNFISEAIHSVATKTPRLSCADHFNQLLSSYPMAINLFGFLLDTSRAYPPIDSPIARIFPNAILTPYAPSARADVFVGAVLQRAVQVLRIDFEIPGRLRIDNRTQHPLGDGTSLDVLIEYRDDRGHGLIGIETKLTEPLSIEGDLLRPDRRYRSVFDRPSSPFHGPLTNELAASFRANGVTQWVRNHLLTSDLEHKGSYQSHQYWTIAPGGRDDVAKAAESHRRALKDPASAYLALTLEYLLDRWRPLFDGAEEQAWATRFTKRYVDLRESDAVWSRLTGERP